MDSAGELVQANIGLAFFRGEKFFRHHRLGYRLGTLQDAQGEAVVGLINAARTHQPEKGPFPPWASRLIDQHLEVAACDAGPIHVSYSAGLGRSSATPKAIAAAQKVLRIVPLPNFSDAPVVNYNFDDADNAEAINHALFSISPSLFVLQHRFGIGGGDPETMEHIAALAGKTRQRIAQILEKALGEMKRLLEK